MKASRYPSRAGNFLRTNSKVRSKEEPGTDQWIVEYSRRCRYNGVVASTVMVRVRVGSASHPASGVGVGIDDLVGVKGDSRLRGGGCAGNLAVARVKGQSPSGSAGARE